MESIFRVLEKLEQPGNKVLATITQVSIMAELIEVWRTPVRKRVENLWTVPQ